MATNGGSALAVGIWYQTLGAATALIAPWQFTGGLGGIHGESAAIYDDADMSLLLESFDMDATVTSAEGIRLIQFKATSQPHAPEFASAEIREIFRNATQAILRHEASNAGSVVRFIVATNRPIGHLALLQDLIARFDLDRNDPSFLTAFGNLEAPAELFSPSAQGRTVHQLARSIVWQKAGDWGVSADECVNACLHAISLFAFAQANHVNLLNALHGWFHTWGILPSEFETYTANILGQLMSQSISGKPNDKVSLMRKAFDSELAIPITAKHIWKNVVDDLAGRMGPDPPTPRPIRSHGLEPWILQRSRRLNGLPSEFSEHLNNETSEASLVVGPPRIFVLVGDGGSGKSIIMAQLFARIAGSVWDWDREDMLNDPTFIGCPIIQAAEPGALEGIPGSLMRWGRRSHLISQPVERIALANGIGQADPAVWLGIDGMDEVSVGQFLPLARTIANYADNHPGIRFVLTSRPEQFGTIKSELNAKGMLRELPIDEFTFDEGINALLQATDFKLKVRGTSHHSEVGTREPGAELTDYNAFERGLHQPLFVGVIRRLFEKGRLELIQRAYNGDAEGLEIVATEYTYTFCERAQRRLSHPFVTAQKIFQALKKLSNDATNPTAATAAVWKSISELVLDDHVQWNTLYTQCVSSGLIRGLGSGSFEWRQPSVAEYLPHMEERQEWQ